MTTPFGIIADYKFHTQGPRPINASRASHDAAQPPAPRLYPARRTMPFSTANIETAATSVSLSTPAAPKPKSGLQQKEKAKRKPIYRNLVCNPSMFGPELPRLQATLSPPSRIPLSSPMYAAISVYSFLSTHSTPPFSIQTRPRTLRRAARRISFGSLANASAASYNSVSGLPTARVAILE
ncbi:hypothetical protein DFH29DRAFT_642064 [Suillus ampliporus]|nr:hypothetical protein DFH29DRAFT_642064 [Suillus ampliporus]